MNRANEYATKVDEKSVNNDWLSRLSNILCGLRVIVLHKFICI